MSHLISTILQNRQKVGLYTSPHVHSIRERFQINQQPIQETTYIDLIDQLRLAVAQLDSLCQKDSRLHPPTFFELTTSLAFLYFARAKTDVAIIEVGMGGRLDSTNICQSQISMITSIGFDHVQQLGNTLESIAREKAGIIKPNVPVLSGTRQAAARQVIQSIAEQRHAPLTELGNTLNYQVHQPKELNPRFDCWARIGNLEFAHENLQCGLAGNHQVSNATLAIAAAELFEYQQGRTRWSSAELQLLISRARLVGRFQQLEKNSPHHPDVVVDIGTQTAPR